MLFYLLPGIACFFYPKKVWRVFTFPFVRDGEPTKFALIWIRINGGCLLFLAGVAVVEFFTMVFGD